MQTSGLSAGDILAITKDHDSNFGENWIWIIGLLIVAGIFGGGNGLFGGRSNSDGILASVIASNNNSGLTRSDLFEGFNNQDVNAQLRGITNGLCDGFYSVNTGMLNGFNGVQRDLCSGFNGVNTNINQARFDMQSCCCQTNRNIDSVRYENAKNTCDIINAGNANTQRIVDTINNYVMEQKDNKIAEQGQLLSEQRIISAMKPQAPIPAYTVPSPYASYYSLGTCSCNSLY